MNYCIDYQKKFKYIDKINEFTITYNKRDTSLLDFLLLYKDKRINIYIEDSEDFLNNNDLDRFKAINEQYPNLNYYLKINDPKQDKFAIKLYQLIKKEENIHYFFDALVNDWDILWEYINMMPTDIYVVENLCFELDKIADILHTRGIKIRTFANVCQTQCGETPSLKTFFIRPEDISIYEDYIDTIEFFGDRDRTEILYKIYAIDKKWFGQLKEIIVGFNSDLDSRFIIPKFAESRIKCGKKCLKGGSCKICERIEELSKVLENNKLLVQVNK